jgi:serine/threonine protein kinase
MKSNLTELQRNRLEALAEEFAERKRQGDSVSIDDYVRQHPELADDIRELFPVVAMLDSVGAKPIRQSLPVKDDFAEIGPGTRIGDYQLIRSIGQGGMGVVYQAQHIVLGSAVAIKLLPSAAGRPKLRERFQREATAAAKMHHPNIVRVFDFGSYGETLYYVMALVEGLGLNDILESKAKPSGDSTLVDHQTRPANELPNASHEPTLTRVFAAIEKLKNERSNASVEPNDPGETQLVLETKEINGKKDSGINLARLSSGSSRQISLWNWVASVGRQASDAIDYAHSVGVIHRDIKPANLMIDADETIFVLDFGLAKLLSGSSMRCNPRSSGLRLRLNWIFLLWLGVTICRINTRNPG